MPLEVVHLAASLSPERVVQDFTGSTILWISGAEGRYPGSGSRRRPQPTDRAGAAKAAPVCLPDRRHPSLLSVLAADAVPLAVEAVPIGADDREARARDVGAVEIGRRGSDAEVRIRGVAPRRGVRAGGGRRARAPEPAPEPSRRPLGAPVGPSRAKARSRAYTFPKPPRIGGVRGRTRRGATRRRGGGGSGRASPASYRRRARRASRAHAPVPARAPCARSSDRAPACPSRSAGRARKRRP